MASGIPDAILCRGYSITPANRPRFLPASALLRPHQARAAPVVEYAPLRCAHAARLLPALRIGNRSEEGNQPRVNPLGLTCCASPSKTLHQK